MASRLPMIGAPRTRQLAKGLLKWPIFVREQAKCVLEFWPEKAKGSSNYLIYAPPVQFNLNRFFKRCIVLLGPPQKGPQWPHLSLIPKSPLALSLEVAKKIKLKNSCKFLGQGKT